MEKMWENYLEEERRRMAKREKDGEMKNGNAGKF